MTQQTAIPCDTKPHRCIVCIRNEYGDYDSRIMLTL